MLTTVGAPFALALALSLVLVPLCRSLALRSGHVARPRDDRWHRRPVALFGGVGIAVVLFTCTAALGVAGQQPVLVLTAAAIFASSSITSSFIDRHHLRASLPPRR